MEQTSQLTDVDTEVEFLTKLLQTTNVEEFSQDNGNVADAEQDTKRFIYAHTKWTRDKLELLLQESHSGKCYKGQVSLTELEDTAEELEMLPVLFLKECREALSATIALPTFQYHLDRTPEGTTFKLVKSCEFQLIYLESTLTELRAKTPLLDAAIALLNVKKEEEAYSKAKSNGADAINARHGAEALNVLSKLQDERDAFERKFLKKLTLLLQTKKNRIAELEKQLADAQRNNSGQQTTQPLDADANADDDETDCSDEDYLAKTQEM